MAKITYECKKNEQYTRATQLGMFPGCGNKQEYDSNNVPKEIYCNKCGNRLR